MKTADKKMLQSRINLVLDQPFFGSLSLRLKLVEDPTCETMWTDGVSIGYNPAFADSLSLNECLGVVGHEVLHVANLHQYRRGNRDKKLWNQACDYAINPLLLSAGMVLPAGCLNNPDYAGLAAEEIYARLLDKQTQNPPKKQPSKPSSEPGGCGIMTVPRQPGEEPGEGEPGEGQPGEEPGEGESQAGEVRDAPNPETYGEQEADTKVATAQAAQQAKACGKLPAGMDIFIKELLRPKVDLGSYLRRFMQVTSATDYTWKLPNKRYMSLGMYLPSLHNETIGPVVFAVDTSGSVGHYTAQFCSEVIAAVEDCNPLQVHIAYADAAVGRMDTFEQGELVEFRPVGGGGTDFRPVFDTVASEGITPACLVYLTDLDGTFPETVPDYPVLWVTVNGSVAPFGETIRMD